MPSRRCCCCGAGWGEWHAWSGHGRGAEGARRVGRGKGGFVTTSGHVAKLCTGCRAMAMSYTLLPATPHSNFRLPMAHHFPGAATAQPPPSSSKASRMRQ